MPFVVGHLDVVVQFRGRPELCRALSTAVVEGLGTAHLATSFLGMLLSEVIDQLLLLPEDDVALDAGEQLGDRLGCLEFKYES